MAHLGLQAATRTGITLQGINHTVTMPRSTFLLAAFSTATSLQREGEVAQTHMATDSTSMVQAALPRRQHTLIRKQQPRPGEQLLLCPRQARPSTTTTRPTLDSNTTITLISIFLQEVIKELLLELKLSSLNCKVMTDS